MTSTVSPQKSRFHRRIWWLLATLSLVLSGGLAAHAWAFGGGAGFPGFGPGMHKEFLQRRLEKMLDEVKATDSQRTAIKNIAARLQSEMEPIHHEHAVIHDQMVKLFSADKVDGAAVEKLRTQAVGLMEKGSQVLTRALVDAGNVLDAGQRQTIIKELQEHHGHWHKR